MTRKGFALLDFRPDLDPSKKSKLRDGLSCVLQVGNTLWVCNDETVSLERFSDHGRDADGMHRYGDHVRFALNDYLRLPVPPAPDPNDTEEADLEGLGYRDGYLWVIGSHSLKRKKPDEENSAEKNIKRLEKVKSDGNRFLLARIPLVEENGTYTLKKTVVLGDRRLVAARLHGDDQSSDLIEAVWRDEHLGAFRGIPGKDNGIDFEGLAVVGDRLFIGLRGPVLRGWAVILEVEPEEDDDDPSVLKLREIGTGRSPYRKHFLQLGGLGVRDLCVQGSDLLVLAGPTMDLDGPVTVFRWPNGAESDGESMVFAKDLMKVLDVPYGQGEDHAEGITLFAPEGGAGGSVLVVYDSAGRERMRGNNAVEADIFLLESRQRP